MPSNPLDITQIPAPRVDFIDKRTGLMAREWYRFFVNIYDLAGGGNSTASLDDLQVGQVGGASYDSIAEMMKTLQELEIQPPVVPSTGSGGTTYSVFTSTTNGLAPASGGGTVNYLRADGTWATPPGTGGVTFANPTALVGSTAVNGVATTVMRSDAAPAIDLTANYTYTGAWTFSRAGTTSALSIYANATTYQGVIGFAGTAEFKMDIASSATGLGVYVTGTKYLAVTAGNVDVPAGTLTVASTSVRDGGILTSGTVNAARLPTFGTAAAGIVPASGGGTTNFLRADGTWAAAGGGVTDGDKGDITVSSSGTVWTIDATVVTNAKLANVATATFKGRTTAGTGSPEDLTGTQATALLDTFTSTLKGLAPLSGGGTTNYLRADGTWAAPPGTGGVSFANPTASVGLTAVNGVATSAMRSDAAPALSVSITPTWTGQHVFNANTGMGVASPTSVLHLKAGTATASTAPLKLTSGTNLTTAEAGAVEYDGSLLYMTPTGTARALSPTQYFYRKNTVTNLTNATGAQSWLALTAGVTVAANTIYYFEGEFQLSTTTTTSHTESHLFALTTATVTNIGYSILRTTVSTTATAPQANYAAAATAVTTTGSLTTAQTVVYRICGTVAIGTGGSINPQIQFNTAAPGAGSTVALGAWFRIFPIGATGSNVSIGTWS